MRFCKKDSATRRGLIAALCLLATCAHAALLTVNSTPGGPGDDVHATRTNGLPFATEGAAQAAALSGDTVHLVGGTLATPNHYSFVYPSYSITSSTPIGCFCYGPTSLYTAWTHFVGDGPSTTIIDNQLCIGANGGQYTGYNCYMAWSGVTFADGIQSYGSNYFSVSGCKIMRADPVLGDIAGGGIADDKIAVLSYNGNYWTVDGNEITHTGDGFSWTTSNSSITNNVIHDVTQDGIDFSGATNVLYQGNDTYGCDDGLNDNQVNPATGVAYDFHFHDDCMQFEMQNDTPANENSYITIRGNRFRYAQGQGIQFNNKTASGTYHNHDILIENNIFGATSGVTPIINDGNPVDNLTIRFNSILLKQTDVTWVSPTLSGLVAQYGLTYPSGAPYPRTLAHYQIAFTSTNEAGLQAYDNLMAEGAVYGSWIRADHNVIQFRSGETLDGAALAAGEIRTTSPQFANTANDDAVLASGSIAINAGTSMDPINGGRVPNLPLYDYYGTRRANPPCIGAYEMPGTSPTAEPVLALVTSSAPKTWVDSFLNGSLTQDMTLTTATQSGIGWTTVGGYSILNNGGTTNATNLMNEPQVAGTYPAIMSNVPTLTSWTYSFTNTATTAQSGGGPIWWYIDANDYCQLNFSGGGGPQLLQVVGGTSTTLGTLPAAFNAPTNTAKNFSITCTPTTGGSNLVLTVGGANTTTYFVPSASIPASGTAWNFGWLKNSTLGSNRNQMTGFSITNNAP